MITPKYGLKYFIHRRLAVRLLIGGTLIAAILSMVTYLTRYDDIGQAATIHALNGIERLRVRVRAIGEEPGHTLASAIQSALDEEPKYRIISRYGHFVYARFYTPDGETLAHRTIAGGPEPTQLEDFLQQSPLQYPALDDPWREATQIGERPYIHLVIAIADSA